MALSMAISAMPTASAGFRGVFSSYTWVCIVPIKKEVPMKKTAILQAFILLFAVSGGAHGIGEKILSIGGAEGWKKAEFRAGITEAAGVRTHPALILSSAHFAGAGVSSAALDLAVSFDEKTPEAFRDGAGNYRLTAAGGLEAVERRFARIGAGAALFPGEQASPVPAGAVSRGAAGPLVIEPWSRNALFAPDNRIGDFTLEFWLYPLNMENGERILSWVSARPARGGRDYVFQRIQCAAVKNRLQWTFTDFFAAPDGNSYLSIRIDGKSPVVPKTWSHHLIRFDSDTGMLEYLLNGSTELIVYASSSGREGGDVYTPIVGAGGAFVLGQFMGIMDEFRIHRGWVESPPVHKYPLGGGRMETGLIDLGEGNSGLVRVDVSGGRTSLAGGRIGGDFRENGSFRFSDDSEMRFFIRAVENPYSRDAADWRAFTPGSDFAGAVRGRYVQVAVDFYPSADGEASPYLEALRISYIPDEPPLPPASLSAVALDGGVRLSWKTSPDTDTAGYLVYYGASGDDYFGEDALQGASPIDAGKRNSIVIEGLKNGTLYYFRVAAYDWRSAAGGVYRDGAYHAGEFSREIRARPLQGLASQAMR
jgi:hypothetical protein